MNSDEFPNRAALVVKGKYKGRIVNTDHDEDDNVICYFGSIMMHANQADIPQTYLRPVTTDDLLKRREIIYQSINPFNLKSVDGFTHLEAVS